MNDTESKDQSAAEPVVRMNHEHEPVRCEQAGESRPREFGGRKGPEPTRYGDWEKNGRCIDF